MKLKPIKQNKNICGESNTIFYDKKEDINE